MNHRERFFRARMAASARTIACREASTLCRAYKIRDILNEEIIKIYDRVQYFQRESAIVRAAHSPSFQRWGNT